MIVSTCFLQYVAVVKKPPRHPDGNQAYAISHRPAHTTWPGMVIAVGLHLGWLALPSNDTATTELTPPQPIMVNWIAATPAKIPTSLAPAHNTERKPQAKLEQPKPRPKAVKPQPVIASASETATPMTVPVSEANTEKTNTETQAMPTPPANSANVANVSESEQAPLSLPNLNADYLNNPPPAYPPLSRQLGEQGKVLLRVLVDADGNVQQVSLRKSSGYERLDNAAKETVEQWRFVPAKRGSQVVSAWVVVPISFSLEG